MTSIAVIGGGPAGFMAAIAAAENSSGNLSIDILDKSKPLKTILWTGNGRCNIANATYDYKELASNYPRGEKFLYSVFSKFGTNETIDWFNSHGLELYTQPDNRIFPKSNDANEVRDLMINRAKELRIKIKSPAQVTGIEPKDGKFIVFVNDEPVTYDKVMISTGGARDKLPVSGYDLAESMGHSVTQLKPSLTAFWCKEIWTAGLAGVSIKDAQIRVIFENKEVIRYVGDFVFTHKGISGPLAFKISSYCAFINYDECSPLILSINLIPHMTQDELEKDILNELQKDSKKSIGNILKKYAPKSVITTLLGTELMDYDKKSSQITREDRKTIIRLLTEAQLSAKASETGEEMVTAGGIELNEVNPKTMESKLVKNLYFCGEILNIDGFTGGFNLQACWSTGNIAGLNIITN